MASYLGKSPARLAITTDDSITSAKIVDNTVTSADILNATITGADLASDISFTTSGSIAFGDAGENISGDGTNLTITSSNQTILDSASTIFLDSNNGIIAYNTGATEYMRVSKSTNSAVIKSSISDGDLIFKGNDGGSEITALSFDMSSAGSALFNSTVSVGGLVVRGGHLTLPGQLAVTDVINANNGIVLGANDEIQFGDTGEKIYGDGTNLQIVSSNALGFDVANGITLDSGSGGTILRAGGSTTYGTLTSSSGDFSINQTTSDKDIIFTGNDGGSTITALTLDMSDAGTALFNSKLGIGTLAASYTPLNTITITGSSDIPLYIHSTDSSNFAVMSDTSGSIKFGTTASRFAIFTGGDAGGGTKPSATSHFANNAVERFTIVQDGKVGIGVATPTQKLSIGDTTSAQIHLHSAGPAIRFSSDTTGGNDATRAFVGMATGNNAFVNGSSNGDFVVRGTSGGKLIFGGGSSTYGCFSSLGHFQVNNTTFNVDATNNRVGIGVISPSNKLHIYSNDTSTTPQLLIEQDGTGDPVLGFKLTDSSTSFSMGLNNSSGDQFLMSYNGTDIGTNPIMSISSTCRIGLIKTAVGSGSAKVQVGDIASFDSNVGIGTTSPAIKLDVQHTAADVASFIRSNNSGAGQIRLGNSDDFVRLSGDDGSFAICNSNNTVNRFNISNTGNIGIGTASPTYTLHSLGSGTDGALGIFHNQGSGGVYSGVQIASDNQLGGGNSDTNLIITRWNGTGTKVAAVKIGVVANNNDGVLTFSTAENADLGSSSYTERMRIDGDTGNIGIGTTSPGASLHVIGGIALGSDTVANHSSGSLTGVSKLVFGGDNDANGVVGGRIYSSGNALHIQGGTSGLNLRGANNSVHLDINCTTGNVGICNNLTVGANLDVSSGTIKLDGDYPTGSNNVALGDTALDSVTSGGQNTAIGSIALTALTTASFNTAIGYKALEDNISGTKNTAIGSNAASNTTGANNVAIGVRTLFFNTSGGKNTAVGEEALLNGTSASQNTALGYQAGTTVSGGSNLTILGYQAEPSSGSATNEITLGNSSVTALRIPGLQSSANDGDVLTFCNANGNIVFKPTALTPTLSSVTGNILAGTAKTLTLAGLNFGTANLVVTFIRSGSTFTQTVTPSSTTAATVTTPSGLNSVTSAGDTVTIKVTNSDNLTSGEISKTVVGLPSGGTITTSGNFRIHTFTSSGTFTNTISNLSTEYLIVAGGGAGGNNDGGHDNSGGSGGGGAGGMRTGSSTVSSTGSFTVTVGGGGSGGSNNGSNSTFNSITSIGGGGGGTVNDNEANGNSGGSGGGAGNDDGSDVASGGSGTSGQGNDGGDGPGPGGSGGGGKGAAGTTVTSGQNGGNGGNGAASSITGSSVTYAGGGGGGVGANATPGSGGSGGGGNGAARATSDATNGSANTGGGGGGAADSNTSSETQGANGGSGIVVIRYDTTSL